MTNYKFITSTNKNNILKFNKRYSDKIKSSLPFFNEDFYQTTNPIIAGSFILREVFSNTSPYEDIDLYFTTSETRDIANSYLQDIGNLVFDTQFATTYLIGTRMRLQIIKTIYETPISLISSFDITPAMICYQPKNNSFTYEIGCLYSWYRKFIKLNTSPLFDFIEINQTNHKEAFLYYNLLSRRLRKYSSRYSMKIDSDLIAKLNHMKDTIISYCASVYTKYTYYYTDSSGNKAKIDINSSNIEEYLTSLLDFKDETLLPQQRNL